MRTPWIATLLVALTPSLAAADDGAAAYKSKCALCHGEKGAGDTAMGKKLGVRSLVSPDVQKLDDAVMAGKIAKGKNKMPPFDKKLTPEQIKSLVAHIRALAKK